MASDASAALTYMSYLALDDVLGAQRPRSDEHDEMLLILVHQVYELWFKQLLHELGHLQGLLQAGDAPRALSTLKRVLTMLKTVVAQIDVLETMTPRQFTTFRDRLDAASGFQSAQFRELEAVLGRRDPGVLTHYPETSMARERIAAAMARPSLFDSFLRCLVAQGFAVPRAAVERDVTQAVVPSQAVQDVLLDAYRDDGQAAQVCERLVDLDDGTQEWRYRHVKMIEQTIGDKVGTGGSSGAAYLRTTLFQVAFPDLWAVRSRL
jgi:tryptophan 2,3-dioxygenase